MGKLGLRLNLSNGGLTQISDLNFTSVGVLGENIVGCTSTYLTEIGGALDNLSDIDSYVSTPAGDYGVPAVKRIRKLYLQCNNTTSLNIKCIPDAKAGFTVSVTPDSTAIESVTLDGRRDNYGVNWRFEITNVDGSDFSIDYFGVLFVPLTRNRGM